jgi:hypothetical protein
MCADNGRLLIACSYELLEAESVEIEREILEEVALEWVVAVAENRFAAQLRLVIFQLVADVAKLGIKLILLGLLCIRERPISRCR